MLVDMKSRVDGCRGLLGKLAATATRAAMLEATPDADPAEIERHRKLQLLLTPICKAFISDQAWRICETAIQVHGGRLYRCGRRAERARREDPVDLGRHELHPGRTSCATSSASAAIRG